MSGFGRYNIADILTLTTLTNMLYWDVSATIFSCSAGCLIHYA